MMMMMEDGERSIGSAEATPTNDDQRQQQHEDLYHSLIFSSQLERDIRQQLKACGTDDFIQYLHDSAVNGDEEERQGLEELISMITTAKLEKEQTPQTPVADTKVEATTDASLEENDTNTNSEPPPPVLSNADLIKRANQIDKAVAAAALSDDEKPSDFISDCREVVNLSGGFNNNGQMRVGGR